MLRQVARPPWGRARPHTPGSFVAVAAALAGCSASATPPATVDIPSAAPLGPEAVASSRPPPAPAPAGDIAWESSDRAAHVRAEREGRPMIVWARAAWDPATLEMERLAWSDDRVIAAAQRFVALRLDLTDADDPEAEAGEKRYEVDRVPTVVLFDAKGRRAAKLEGLVDARALATALAKVSP